MTGLLWACATVPAVVGAGLCVSGRRADRVAPAVGIVTAGVVLALSVAVALGRPATSAPFLPGAVFGLAVDALAAVVLPAVAAVTLLVLVFSAADVSGARARYTGLLLLFAAAVVVTVCATTLPALLFAWEVMGATSYALIGFRWQEPHRVGAGLTAFLTTRTADLGLYLAAGAALAGGSGLALADLPGLPAPWRDVAAAGLLVAALGKAAQLPFTAWLSAAMQGPSPVSALLHSAAMVAMGGYLLLRVSPLLGATSWAGPTAAWVGALTALLLGAVALAQRDLKQLLAASTAAQLGFVVLGAGVAAVAGGTAHLVAHAATKALLFLAAGAWLTALGTKQLPALRGAARRWPLVGVCAAVGALALAGVAPLSLWATKDAVLAGAHEESLALYLVGLAAAALSAGYAGKVLWLVWQRLPADAEAGYDTEEEGTRQVRALQQAPLVVLAAGAAVLGLLALPPVGDTLRQALDGSGPTPGLVELAVSAVVAVVVLLLVRVRPLQPLPGWLEGWLGLARATDVVVVRPVLHTAEALARFDDRVLARAVTGAGRGALRTARAAARFDDGVLDRAVAGSATAGVRLADATGRADLAGPDAAVRSLAAGTRWLGGWARRTQTGQLHQYYVSAAVVLAAALALLLAVR
ncbi:MULTISPECIES: proton-conducting transporter transmembrane domain-containing protein [unclassified Modestobacter]|uniref:proton-conducting transporter transmembrane domain-containing protein n=1 Tax=unclassified Modestobacter TaxID=2643866 RepID=UPI0022AAB116|nr:MULTISPECIES: proton-conducting transporter membrane subunit [unclassified Modestobacter]MCZ2826367.1 proton-conducting transporter membrane subunit [Modestobacter sp. VKM Ac-2981]MCZ2852568.1 proton-conducting transporter membrane subunit [Modestobacter sp. VKM Ac-2982]